MPSVEPIPVDQVNNRARIKFVDLRKKSIEFTRFMAKSTGAYVSDGIEAVSAHGPFALGFFLGALISYFYGRLASGEIKARMKIDLEREQELREQNKLKDDRIEKLHGQIEKLVNKKKGK